jgi:hypothetical protein
MTWRAPTASAATHGSTGPRGSDQRGRLRLAQGRLTRGRRAGGGEGLGAEGLGAEGLGAGERHAHGSRGAGAGGRVAADSLSRRRSPWRAGVLGEGTRKRGADAE